MKEMNNNDLSTGDFKTSPANDTDDKFDLAGLFLDFLSKWKWFVLSIIIFGTAAYFYVETIIPTYEVDASIYLNSEKAKATGQTVFGIENDVMMGNDIINETEIEILKSKNNLMKIVDSLNLSYTYYKDGRLCDMPVYHNSAVTAELDSISLANLTLPIYASITKESDGYHIKGEVRHADGTESKHLVAKKLPVKMALSVGTVTFNESPFTNKMTGTEKIIIRNPRRIAAMLSANLTIKPADAAPSILNIYLKTPVIEEGVDIIKAIVDFYNRQIIEDKNRSAIQTEAFILDRLVMINSELKDVEDRLRKYREEHNIADLEAQTSMNLATRSSNEEQLASVDADMEILKDIEQQVRRQDSYAQLPAYSNNSAVTQSIETYNRSVSNYQRSIENMGEAHPAVEKLREELIKQKSQILGNLSAARTNLTARRRSIAAIDSRSSGQLAVQPTIDKGLNEIFREQQVKVNIYTFLLQKREEIALQKTLATPTAQFIDNPSGFGPVAPHRFSYIALGLLIGLLLPAVIIFIKRLLFPKFNDMEDLERLTKLPILGEICKSGNAADGIVIGENVSTPEAELFRLLRNNINFTGDASVHGEDKNKVILVTSSVSGEGKTFITLNLAVTYALTRKKVVMVGLDIRRPVLARIAGKDNREGVTTFLSGQTTDLDSLISQSDVSPNLYILPAGPVPPNPNELMLGENMAAMFNRLRKNFDVVIVDSAPIGMVSDTFIIAPYTDIQIYVTRAGVSTKKGLKLLHDAVRNNRLSHPYLVLNGVNVGSASYIYRRYGHYGYYSKQSYGYAYGYGYSSAKKKKFRLFGKKKHRK